MNEVQIYKNETLGLQIKVMVNEDGSISMNAEDTAIEKQSNKQVCK